MSIEKSIRSQSLDLLRFPLAIIVLVRHVFAYTSFTIYGTPIDVNQSPLLREVNLFITGFLNDQSVPIYFFISGYVFFLGRDFAKEVYLHKLTNRVKSLLIPYIIWNAITILYTYSLRLPIFSSFFPNINKDASDLSISTVLSFFWNCNTDSMNTAIYPIDGPLWFVRDLMILVLFTPLLYYLVKRTKAIFIVSTAIIWFLFAYLHAGHFNQLATALFFFSFGAYMSIYKKDMLLYFNRYFTQSILLYFSLSLLYVASAHWFPMFTDTIKRLNILIGLYFAYNLSSYLIIKKKITVSKFLTASSFFIYVTHCIIHKRLIQLTYSIINPTNEVAILSVYIVTTITLIGLLLGCFYLLQRFTPKFLQVITGRRMD